MYIVIQLNNFNIKHVFYQSKIKNTMMENSNFIRIVYSNELFILNGIFIKFDLNLIVIEKSFNKYKCLFDPFENIKTIESIGSVEKQILEQINYTPLKKPIYRIYEQLHNGFLKIFNDAVCNDKNDFVLKIYGVWENDTEYGLTYKFINI
jgi:hypothetical protein